MNFLAHLYLSGNNEEIIVGNFIGDYVKGREYIFYSDEIQKGIMLHRYIDTFTDSHPVTKQSRQRVQYEYHKYAGIIIDIFYDYFLACEWKSFHYMELDVYIQSIFEILKKHYYEFPLGIKNWFPNFLKNNWLLSYSSIEGIENILHRMSSRTSLPENTRYAIEILRQDEEALRKEFYEFFDSIRAHILQEHGIITGLELVGN